MQKHWLKALQLRHCQGIYFSWTLTQFYLRKVHKKEAFQSGSLKRNYGSVSKGKNKRETAAVWHTQTL